MNSLIECFFKPTLERMKHSAPEMAVELATAVLLIEVSRADFEQRDDETREIRKLLLDHLSLCEEEVEVLLQHASDKADDLVSLQHVTRLLNEKMQQQEKRRVIELMWRVVYADGEKHHYEEHLMRQVADLLYISHEDFIRARHQAESTIA